MRFFLGHEAYVLTPSQIQADHHQKVNFFAPLANHHDLTLFLLFSAGIAVILGICVWFKTTRVFKALGELLNKGSIIAPDIVRATFGAALIASATHTSLFGPEIPLQTLPFSSELKYVLLLLGIMAVIGLGIRLIAVVATVVWCIGFAEHGAYLLTYTNYLGEALALFLMPQQFLSVDHLLGRKHASHAQKVERSNRWGMPIARLLFAFALLYTAVTVKIIYAAEPLQVVNQYHLTQFFPFDPAFVVFGAGLTELLIAGLYMIGLLQRLNTVVFITFITLSLLYFKEAVWPHYLLLGLGLGIFLHRPDAWSADYLWFKSRTKSKRVAVTASKG